MQHKYFYFSIDIMSSAINKVVIIQDLFNKHVKIYSISESTSYNLRSKVNDSEVSIVRKNRDEICVRYAFVRTTSIVK